MLYFYLFLFYECTYVNGAAVCTMSKWNVKVLITGPTYENKINEMWK